MKSLKKKKFGWPRDLVVLVCVCWYLCVATKVLTCTMAACISTRRNVLRLEATDMYCFSKKQPTANDGFPPGKLPQEPSAENLLRDLPPKKLIMHTVVVVIKLQ